MGSFKNSRTRQAHAARASVTLFAIAPVALVHTVGRLNHTTTVAHTVYCAGGQSLTSRTLSWDANGNPTSISDSGRPNKPTC